MIGQAYVDDTAKLLLQFNHYINDQEQISKYFFFSFHKVITNRIEFLLSSWLFFSVIIPKEKAVHKSAADKIYN